MLQKSDRFRASDQHELPPDCPGLALFQGLLHLVERQGPLDRDGELPALNHLFQALQTPVRGARRLSLLSGQTLGPAQRGHRL